MSTSSRWGINAPYRDPVGMTMRRINGYIHDYNRDSRCHDNQHVVANIRQYWGLRARDFVDEPPIDLWESTWKERTPFGHVLYTNNGRQAHFEPAQGFDLASQDWPPPCG